MKTWLLGDSILAPVVKELVGEDNLIDSSTPNAIMEEVWVEQIHAIHGVKEPVHAILFINSPDYDSEVLIWNILHRAKEGTRITLCVFPANARAAEGMEAHYVGDKFRLIKLMSLEPTYVKSILQA